MKIIKKIISQSLTIFNKAIIRFFKDNRVICEERESKLKEDIISRINILTY